MSFREHWLKQRYLDLKRRDATLLYSGRPFEAFAMAAFLDALMSTPELRALMTSRAPARAFEYGTGTGPGACDLAARGFRVDAIDISADAIEIAKRIASERRLEIDFSVRDITAFEIPRGSYDLILDNHCLHHIVLDDERARTLRALRDSLRSHGLYVLETVVSHPGRDYAPDRFDVASATKLVRIPEPVPSLRTCADVVEIEGAWYWKKSRHLRPQDLKSELERAGFIVAFQSIFGGLLSCVRDDYDGSIEALHRSISAAYRDDPEQEAIRLQHTRKGSGNA